MPPGKTLIVCAGLQSSGTTLISYCFLQRSDTDGVLDAEYDLLPAIDSRLARPYAWYKTTISCFRLSEIAGTIATLVGMFDRCWYARPPRRVGVAPKKGLRAQRHYS